MASQWGTSGVSMERSTAFWAKSQAWTTQRRRQIDTARAAGQGGSDQIVRKEARWQRSLTRYLRSRPDLSSSSFDGVRVPPELYAKVLDLLGAIAPKLQGAFDQHLGKLAADAFDAWPVASGLSKSMISLEYDVSESGERFTGTIRSRAPYTVFIFGQPHRTLLDRPGAAVADRIAAQALDEIVKGV